MSKSNEVCVKCKATGCCMNCTNYGGGFELTPTRIIVTCAARLNDKVVLPYNAYPEINGKAATNCKFWVQRKFKKVNKEV